MARPAQTMMNRIAGLLALLVMTSSGGFTSAQAADGRFELNQVQVESEGGFPYVIDRPGSYLLTSDLVVPLDKPAIQISSDGVNLDLNGFAIRSSFICSTVTCVAGSAIGIEAKQVISELARDVTIRNGAVMGFTGDCITLGANSSIENLVVRNCGASGVFALEHATVNDSRISDCGGWGINFIAAALYGGNIIQGVDRLTGTGYVLGGTETHSNICESTPCKSKQRRFYLKTGATLGNHGALGCETGFHMASIFELMNPGNLRYDTSLGSTNPDSGQGPPDETYGWVRGGSSSESCRDGISPWNTASAAFNGTRAKLVTGATDPDNEPRWQVTLLECSAGIPLWCIEN